MIYDPNRAARRAVAKVLDATDLRATERLLDLLVDAVLDAETREDAIVYVGAMTGLPRGTCTKLVDLATEALENGGEK